MRALITGITGQDGSYLAELLLSKGYEVHGIVRRSSTFNTDRIEHIYTDPHDPDARLFLHYGELSDSEQLTNIIYNLKPDEIYHLGAMTHVRVSFDIPEYTGNVTGLGATRVLEAVRRSGNNSRVYQASSSEMFGSAPPPQDEETPFKPRSPYACAKVYAYWMAKNYRDGYNMFVTNGVLHNHESPRRGETFVTKKMSRGVARILAGKDDYLYLGNLDAKRDWGFTPEYVELMHKMLQHDKPDDFVVGTGECHTVKDFLDEAFNYAGLDVDEHVRIDERYLRPTETDYLVANPKKVRKTFNWKQKICFKDLVKIMVDSDMRHHGLEPIGEGYNIIEKKFQNKWWN